MEEKKYFLPADMYDVMKWIGLICLPAIAVLISTIGPVWGMPDELCNALVTTFNAVGVFFGVVIGASAITSKNVSGEVEESEEDA